MTYDEILGMNLRKGDLVRIVQEFKSSVNNKVIRTTETLEYVQLELEKEAILVKDDWRDNLWTIYFRHIVEMKLVKGVK